MTDPFAQFFQDAGEKLEQLERDTKPVEPRARVVSDADEAFSRISDALHRQILLSMSIPPAPEPHLPSGENTIWGDILDAYRMIEAAPPARSEPIKLTEQQIAAVRMESAAQPTWGAGVAAALFGVPIEKVDTVEESTPYQERMARVAAFFDERRQQRDQVLAEHLAAANRWAAAFVGALAIAAALVIIAGWLGWLA